MLGSQIMRSSGFRQPSRNLNIGAAFRDMLRKTMGGRKTTLGSARSLLFNCKHQADNSQWYTHGKIGDEFISKHTVLMTHAWIVHKRLLVEGAEGLRTQEAMFDELWEDTCARMRAIGINELSINKHLGEVQTHSFKYCMELDEALKKETEPEILHEMGGAIWRNAYAARDDLEDDHVMEFANYVRKEYLSIMEMPYEAVHGGRIAWSRPPKWSNSGIKDVGVQRSVNAVDPAGEWMTAISSSGTTYYWNTVTRQSQWEKPETAK